MTASGALHDIEQFLNDNPAFRELLADPQKRDAIAALCTRHYDRLAYLMQNPWLDMERIVSIADSIMNISPNISRSH